MDLARDEAIRREYLAAMGITQWYARHPLEAGAVALWAEESAPSTDVPKSSGAAGARQMVASMLNDAQESAPTPQAEQPAPPVRPVAAPERVVVPTDEAKATGSPEPEAPLATQTRQQGIEFMQQWWARDGWLLVDTRPKKMPVAQQQAADRLLAAIAFTLTGQAAPSYSNLVDWPLFVNRSIKHDLAEAQFYLQQKWQAVQQATPITRLILLGDQTPRLLNCESAAAGGASTWEWQGIRCLHGPSTSELLHLPGMKRDFWRVLQPWMQVNE